MTTPVIDVHEDFIEVWWCPPPIGHGYRVLRDRWDYDGEVPVRFVFEISQS